MVFGEALTVPGEFFPTSDIATETDHLARLRHVVGKYRPCIQTHSTSPPQHIPKSLNVCKHVFVRNDAHRSPLTRPYRGPYAVLGRNPKAFRLSIAEGSDWVSIDRLKPAYIEEEDVTLTVPPADDPAPNAVRPNASAPTSPPEGGSRCISSRAGRLIRRPNRLNL
ncbi:hypothetical protein Pcinc_008809 [Petrolisthes cinctipes]|uniref:Gag-pol polyprotein n=1 Tax=Petrolisthes cinctipes TaxID=88211 RepID=A0AAE1G850_PETCI|nr:hypothetical protein Pcinc_008809 [Petrolisthes cinctipes]